MKTLPSHFLVFTSQCEVMMVDLFCRFIGKRTQRFSLICVYPRPSVSNALLHLLYCLGFSVKLY